MFRRYSESARRVVFFARYEARHHGSNKREAEQLRLGQTREMKHLRRWVPHTAEDSIRVALDSQTARLPGISTNFDLPSSEAGKKSEGSW